jgi:hypothetical protein
MASRKIGRRTALEAEFAAARVAPVTVLVALNRGRHQSPIDARSRPSCTSKTRREQTAATAVGNWRVQWLDEDWAAP